MPQPHRRRAFTLLELLVVFTIIAILISVFMLVGHKIMAGSKTRATQNVLQTLDQAMEAYTQAKGRFPDRFIDANKNEFPLADAYLGGTQIPSGEFTLEVLKSEPASAAIIQKIPSEFIETVDTTNATPIPAINGVSAVKTSPSGTTSITFIRVKDAWGKPIRFVHPSFHGIYGTGTNPARDVTLRQNGAIQPPISISRSWSVSSGGGDPTFSGQGDGGFCKGGRPYFYSAGADGNPASVEDNVYSVQPQFDAAVKAAGQ